MSDNVFCVMLDQPNGVSEVYFDDHDHMCHALPAYQEMFSALKMPNIDSAETLFENALTELEACGYLSRYLVYSGVYMEDVEEEITEQLNGDKYRIFDGEPYMIDSIIKTSMPIR